MGKELSINYQSLVSNIEVIFPNSKLNIKKYFIN